MSSPRVVFKTTAFERPLVTVDVVIFTVMADQLYALLVRRPESDGEPYPARWALPGGFVDVERDASLLACAERKLRDKTGVAAPYLEQLGSWGDAKRDPRGWSSTHAYFALIPKPEAADGSATTTEWVPCDQAARRRLAFDHNTILSTAIERLRSKVEYTSLPAFLLPEPFTLPQLQRVYEVVLGRRLDKSAFRKRMLDAAYLEEAGMVTGDHGRAAMGYRLRERDQATVFPRTFKSSE
ncbi:MAG TPA: DNA mismatch repair protein MutT [Hydrogenophaga sp.]|uniref:NUDIX hydrolase n=1 Tax=Hydrogenophaga sp. TaxID=1904254 RepID=UPI0008D6963B|nr:NUDIX domain-containing protein [Hydrogenophaga sp.]OGA76228.1 MAG: DNA mismatch repair protein MutT [Burkholderiales bacterium GWE1_65_30]OGA91237.1 MAG: DNA mismatch repair protein MutT [Burkholderiales bacterium GWF1_66_17]HAX22212.1 DNA mismatch repair protein MutT [Hydrogenophaga sp.]HBU20497.1 DNA mismatch repair protein MutT [Hydrogenophaga sp.]